MSPELITIVISGCAVAVTVMDTLKKTKSIEKTVKM